MTANTPWMIGENGTTIFDANSQPVVWCKHRVDALRVVLADGRVPEKPLDRVKMLCERHSTKEPDYDNLVASFKPIRDGLVEMGLLIDDKPSILVKCDHRWVKASRGAGKVRILLRAASDD